jgi:hydrogenase maturation protein HypF
MNRRAIVVSGIVQGVGFRPFVYQLACRLGLVGLVKNQTGGVWIEVEGDDSSLDQFLHDLTTHPPPLAQIKEIHCLPLTLQGERQFRIEVSEGTSASSIFIGPDVATCDACLAELFDPQDRRYRYPFLNCTHCGPRLTIIRRVPYDREQTTMAGFALCPACRAEYDDPANRRFHAQPTACARCGPHLFMLDQAGRSLDLDYPLAHAVDALRWGLIGAVKGLGGYHLACVAVEERPVAELRRRKHRDDKPFAIMVADLAAALKLCEVSAAEAGLLLSSARPIVLLRRRPGSVLASQVAPGNPYLGVMLPYTPLHHLLLHDLGGLPLVMTSGNQSDEPIAYDDEDAQKRLAGIADFFLTHNRPIHLRCDDSVTRIVAGQEQPIRRSRGFAPQPITLPRPCRQPTLAVGGQLKSTFGLGREQHALLSHHLGDLDHYPAYRAFVEAIGHYEHLFALQPRLLVCDMHPDYASTRYARERADREGLPLLSVQHHEAHVASCMAEHGLQEPVIGVAFDGTGFGADGKIWGGEFFWGDYGGFQRAAHLRYVAMPGGERAVREPWRMAAAHLLDVGETLSFLKKPVSSLTESTLRKMILQQIQTPFTSSAGRLFDAVAALAGVRQSVNYEGQAAIELEWLASEVAPSGCYPFEILDANEGGPILSPLIIDSRPLIRSVVEDVRLGTAAAVIGRRFHTTMAEIILAVCQRIRAGTGLSVVALSGGVFLNALLTEDATTRLAEVGFRVFRQCRVPPNDGGLCLGQLAIAAALS